MKNKVLIIRGQNNVVELESDINKAISKVNKAGWHVVSASTTSAPFGERNDLGSLHDAWHVYYVATILLGKEG